MIDCIDLSDDEGRRIDEESKKLIKGVSDR